MERLDSVKEWYLLWDGKSVGPWSTETVIDHLEERKLKGTDRILGAGETEWREIRNDPAFSRHLKRKPRRKEKLKAPRPVKELLQERKNSFLEIQKAEAVETPETIRLEPVFTEPTKAPERPFHWSTIVLPVSALALFALLLLFHHVGEKTRGPEDIHPPNPPGPATAAPEESDPNSLLKPPTRPERP